MGSAFGIGGGSTDPASFPTFFVFVSLNRSNLPILHGFSVLFFT